MTYETYTLHDLEFSYLYLGHARIGDGFTDVGGTRVQSVSMHPQLQDELLKLKEACRVAPRAAPVFKVECEGVSYRVSAMNTAEGEVFVLRRLGGSIAALTALGVPAAYVRQMLRPDLTGLVVVSGAAKSGKTTTASALVRERLIAHGGIAITAEDPIELQLEGRHGDGVCYQTQVGADRVDTLRSMMCLGARMLFVGSLDDGALCVEILQAALDGQLVITTTCSNDIGKTISRLHALGTRQVAAANIQALIADGLAGVLHQRFVGQGGIGKIETQCFMLRDAPAARQLVRSGRYDEMMPEIRQQMTSMIQSNALAERMGAN